MAQGVASAMKAPIGAIGAMVSGMTSVNPARASNTVNNNYYTTLEMNPSYANYQSEAGVYYDAVAALSTVSN